MRNLFPGDVLALYTDGVTESLNSEGEGFGEQRLIEAAKRYSGLSSSAMLAAVVGEVRRFGDLVVAKCRG